MMMSTVLDRHPAYFVACGLRRTKPNKAPEPTIFAVTSRAIVRLIKMEQQNPDPIAARAAPAKVVAHL
jgi:hypothetical protein